MMGYGLLAAGIVILVLSGTTKYYKGEAENAKKEAKLNSTLLKASEEREGVCNGKVKVFKLANDALQQSTEDKERARLAAEELRKTEEAKSKKAVDELKAFKKTGDTCADMKGIVDAYSINRK